MLEIKEIRPAIKAMQIGETKEFPIEQMRTVRCHSSELGMILNRKYVTRTDRETRTITVERIR